MLFYGHFSFSYTSHDSTRREPWHGFLTTLVEADDVDRAVSKCRRLIRRLRKQGGLETEVKEVYLETLAEVRSMPASGLVPFLERETGRDTGESATISAYAPLAPKGALQLYRYGQRPEGEEETDYKAEPFLVFKAEPSVKTEAKPVNPETTRKGPSRRKAPRGRASSHLH